MSEAVLSDPIDLIEPVKRGDHVINSVRIRKPRSGELRGLSMNGIMTSDIDTHLKLLPRVTMEPLLAHEVDDLCPSDLLALMGGIINFFMTAEQKDSALEQLMM